MVTPKAASTSIARPRYAWLLWLALLLPLAQAAANWHAQSHWNTDRGSPSGEQHGLAGDRCDLCLTAAALSSGAVPGAPLPALPAAAPQSLPAWRPAPVRSAALSLAYESRAPPFALR